jgi:flagellar protein FliS
MNTHLHRQRYVDDAVATASPARLLCMLYDRLVRDLRMAELAIDSGEAAAASAQLLHAQEIVLELHTSLDATKWNGAARLASVYSFLHSELVQANIKKDAARVRSCRSLVEPLALAWHEAAVDLLAVGTERPA